MPSIAVIAPSPASRLAPVPLHLCLEATAVAADAGADIRIAVAPEPTSVLAPASVDQLVAEEALEHGGHVTFFEPCRGHGAWWPAVLRVVYGPRAVEIISLDPGRHYAWLHFAAKRARDDATARLLAVAHGAVDNSDLAILVPASWPADPVVEHAAVMARVLGIEAVNLISLADCQRLWERVQRRRVA